MNLENIKLKNFIKLSYDEKLMVLSWRNNLRIRKNMYSNKIINVKNHLNFIKNLVDDKENKYFLLDDIGVIYFNNIANEKAEIGLYSNPEKYGVGDILMKYILSFNFEYLYLEVLETNKKAVDLYLKYNFKIKNKKLNKNKKIICMELKNENR